MGNIKEKKVGVDIDIGYLDMYFEEPDWDNLSSEEFEACDKEAEDFENGIIKDEILVSRIYIHADKTYILEGFPKKFGDVHLSDNIGRTKHLKSDLTIDEIKNWINAIQIITYTEAVEKGLIESC